MTAGAPSQRIDGAGGKRRYTPEGKYGILLRDMIPDTSTTLLRDVKDAEHPRWTEFVAKYRPMMEAYLKSHFPSVEADDAIQETFAALGAILPGYIYDPDEKGRFRSYLTGILRNKARRELRKNSRRIETGSAAVQDGNGEPALAAEERSWREAVFEIALRRFLSDETIADRTKRILERTALNGESPESVAASLKMTRHAVDQAKSRAMSRLRQLVKELESVYG